EGEILKTKIEALKIGKNILDDVNSKSEFVSVNGRDGLKRTYFIDNSAASIEIKISIEELIYSFSNNPIFSQKCVEYFNKMIETVKIER
ncbi:MAG: hypothetical protein Q8N69_00820, partial [bacterium]|nr:hypothetical protein [bacterium]